MLKYKKFIEENISEYNISEKKLILMIESKVEYSERFKGILDVIDHPVSKALAELANTDKDGLVQNWIDLDLDNNNQVSFVRDDRATRILADIPETYKLNDTQRHLKKDGFSSENAERSNRNIYERLGMTFAEANHANHHDEVVITAETTSERDPSKIYVAYKGVVDETKRGVITKEGLTKRDRYATLTDKMWREGRNPIRVGRLVRALLQHTGKKFNDADIEQFVNLYKSRIDILNDVFLKFKIVKGGDIYNWYQSDNYSSQKGVLGSSCMKEAPKSWLEIYTSNPEVCEMVILFDDNGKITGDGKYESDKIKGRALLWTMTSGEKFMDRIYTNNDSDIQLFKDFAIKNKFWYKRTQNADTGFTAICGDATIQNRWILVKIGASHYERYPYLDSLCYFDQENQTLSNNEDGHDICLRSAGGGHEDWDPDDDWDDDD